MSVVAMKKLTLLAPREYSDALLSKLIKLRCVEVHRSEIDEEYAEFLSPCRLTDKKSELEDRISRTETVISILSKYEKKKFSFVKPKIETDLDAFLAAGDYDRARRLLSEIEALIEEKKECSAVAVSSDDRVAGFTPWVDLDVPLDFSGTEKTFLIKGVLPVSADISALNERLSELYALCERVGDDAHGYYTVIIGLREFENDIMRTLAAFGFNKWSESGDSANITARQSWRLAKQNGEKAAARAFELDGLIASHAGDADLLKVLCDFEKTELEKAAKHELLIGSGSVEMLTGWVPEEKMITLIALFDKFGCAYSFEDPTEDDDVPVLLKNNKFAKNFEWIISLYSLPRYGSFDPTFIMAICYSILFGIMFADVGYGLVMVLVGFLVPKILNPSPWANGFFRSFGWCGVACIVMGVLFGGYFGDLPIKVAQMFGFTVSDSFSLALVMDPVKQSMPFMIMGIAVGAVHLIIGMIIKFNIIRKQQSWLDAIFDVGLWWVLFAGIALIFIAPDVGPWVLGAGALGIFLTGGRHEKKWIMKPLKGLLSFYDIINYASDLLSYSRILALALTSAVIASVVNVLGTMAGPSVPGIIVLIIAFVFGHALNIALNVMGTFVHSARLQYVEFFGKFFEDGGRAFDPAKPSGKYTKS